MRTFKIKTLTESLKEILFIEFAFVFGSSQNGQIKKGSDLDLAIFFTKKQKIGFDEIAKILEVIDLILPGVECDICRLNTAGETLKMEALKGNLLFVNDIETYADFYTKTCSEYEDYIYWTNKQLQYRGYAK